MLLLNRFVLTFLICIVVTGPAEAKHETGFLDRLVVVNAVSYKYQVYVPENWTAARQWPVILFLHGSAERGEDGLVQTEVGIGTAIRRDRARFPTIVVMPQSRADGWWTEPSMTAVAMAALSAASKEFRGDLAHTYLSGLSMGGYGAWRIAGEYPNRFAALVPICGGIVKPEEARSHASDDMSVYTEAARKIGSRTPVWIFHGGDDTTVPVLESRRMYEALKALGADVKYTEYPGVGHASWENAYAESELMPWILSKSLLTRHF